MEITKEERIRLAKEYLYDAATRAFGVNGSWIDIHAKPSDYKTILAEMQELVNRAEELLEDEE